MPRRDNQLTVTFKAGDCRFWNTKHPDIGESWSEQGLLEFANAPDAFQPNLHKLADERGTLGSLAEILRNYDASQLRILMAVLHDSYKLQAFDLKFGQPVYKNLSAPHADYVDCWFRCYVVALGPQVENDQYIYITGSLDDIHGTLMLVPYESVLTRGEFVKHRRKLEVKGLLNSPTSERGRLLRHKWAKKEDVRDFPTIADVANELREPSRYEKIASEDAPRPAKRAKQTKRKHGQSSSVKIV